VASGFRHFGAAMEQGLASWYRGPEADIQEAVRLSCVESPHRRDWHKLRMGLQEVFHEGVEHGPRWDELRSHPFFTWTQLPEYDECPLGALAVRLAQI
jgi:hypothetical protein